MTAQRGPARLILASASPARLRTLRAAGVEPDVVVSGVAEDDVDADSPAQLAQLLAGRKARAVAGRVLDGLVLGCDSVLELDGRAYGKPGSAAQATARWQAMRGRSGILHTGHCLIDVQRCSTAEATAATTVHFADLSDEEISAYVGTGEPLLVAGAFTLDGYGGAFVERIEGDPHNVVGLSLPLLRRMLAELGVPWTALWSSATRG